MTCKLLIFKIRRKLTCKRIINKEGRKGQPLQRKGEFLVK